jgi:hypothetical protein
MSDILVSAGRNTIPNEVSSAPAFGYKADHSSIRPRFAAIATA